MVSSLNTTTFAPPRPSSSSSLTTDLTTTSGNYLSTSSGELAFFRSLIYHRPLGPDAHFEMLSVLLKFRHYCKTRVSEGFEEYKGWETVGMGEFWKKYEEVWDRNELERTWENEQYDEGDSEELSPSPPFTDNQITITQDSVRDTKASTRGAPSSTNVNRTKTPSWILERFPRKEFSLLSRYSRHSSDVDKIILQEPDVLGPDSTFNEMIVNRKLKTKDDPTSPVGDLPVKEFDVESMEDGEEGDGEEEEEEEEDVENFKDEEESEESEENGRSRKRSRRNTAVTSNPNNRKAASKKQKVGKKTTLDVKQGGDEDGSESELTDMDDDDEEEVEDEALSHEEDGNEGEENGEGDKTTASSKAKRKSWNTRSSSVATADQDGLANSKRGSRKPESKPEPKTRRTAATKKR